ncbi:hypothetical protein RJ45_13645 [Photobacterium gaetbulicola]|uniref:Lipoprotein n=1 Tax=Photobacterium gaetbulicola TaxID=1295392 RepID=A0A0B9GWL1_9GAMM|nr:MULTISPECIES: hypothetical protein [Photobacterium]KHT63121.1 hypothetical protein RJ45_13645 [Photobacterium gaetbulicola]WEM42803.1 hypothetical protein PTW35_02910 [Photobacterium sp. DA100]
MARFIRFFLLSLLLVLVSACTSQYEANLANNKQWEELGAYHGEQGYREWNQAELGKHGAYSETDYEKYRAGYLQGRFDYCSGKHTVGTVINPGYPDECQDNQSSSSYGLLDRGY